jgi:hypothetical protein
VAAHLLEICAHSNSKLREWGSIALTSLVRNAIKFPADEGVKDTDIGKREQIILTPLATMSEIEYVDVKSKQLDCLMHILQSESQRLKAELWPTIIRIVTTIVETTTG